MWLPVAHRVWNLATLYSEGSMELERNFFKPHIFAESCFMPAQIFSRQPERRQLWLKLRRLQNAMRYSLTYYSLLVNYIDDAKKAEAIEDIVTKSRSILYQLSEASQQFYPRLGDDIQQLPQVDFQDLNHNDFKSTGPRAAIDAEMISLCFVPKLLAGLVRSNTKLPDPSAEADIVVLCQIEMSGSGREVDSCLRDLFIAGLYLTEPAGTCMTSKWRETETSSSKVAEKPIKMDNRSLPFW